MKHRPQKLMLGQAIANATAAHSSSDGLVTNPAVSESQRRYLNSQFGHEWVKEHHFDNAGPLPKRKRKRKKKRPGKQLTANSITAIKARRNKQDAGRANPLRADPTRTATLRRIMAAHLNRQFAELRRRLVGLVEGEDAFGLLLGQGPHDLSVFAANFNPNHDRMGRFTSSSAEDNAPPDRVPHLPHRFGKGHEPTLAEGADAAGYAEPLFEMWEQENAQLYDFVKDGPTDLRGVEHSDPADNKWGHFVQVVTDGKRYGVELLDCKNQLQTGVFGASDAVARETYKRVSQRLKSDFAVTSNAGPAITHYPPYDPLLPHGGWPLTVNDAALDAAAAEADPSPTPAQRDAGNYRHGHVRLHGLDITIETAAGTKRKPWHEKPLAWHYGYVKRSEGADGDHVDIFLGPDMESKQVFVVDQVKQDGSFDEHKCLLGWDSVAAAKAAYLANYPDDWQGFGGITETQMEDFKDWLAAGDMSEPLSSPAENSNNPEGCNQHTGPSCSNTLWRKEGTHSDAEIVKEAQDKDAAEGVMRDAGLSAVLYTSKEPLLVHRNEEGEVDGAVMADLDGGMTFDFGVAPEAQGGGVGKKLLEEAIGYYLRNFKKLAKKQELMPEDYDLSAIPSNPVAARMMEKVRFEKDGESWVIRGSRALTVNSGLPVLDEHLAKNVFNPDEPRDAKGRWGSTGAVEVSEDRSEGSKAVFSTKFSAGDTHYVFTAMSFGSDKWRIVFGVPEPPAAAASSATVEPDKPDATSQLQFKLTGTGAAVEVLSKVGDSLERFIKAKGPAEVGFGADKAEPSRVRLYDRLAKKIAAAYGYESVRTEGPGVVDYRLKKTAASTANAEQELPDAEVHRLAVWLVNRLHDGVTANCGGVGGKPGPCRRFVPHPNQRTDEVTVLVNPQMLDESWQIGGVHTYIPPGGGGAEIKGRREGVSSFLETGKPFQASRGVLHGGDFDFIDGRHRFSVLRDRGESLVAITVPKDQVEEVMQRFGGRHLATNCGGKGGTMGPCPTVPPASAADPIYERADRLIQEGKDRRAAKEAAEKGAADKLAAKRQVRADARQIAKETFGEGIRAEGNEITHEEHGRSLRIEVRPSSRSMYIDFSQAEAPEQSAKREGSSGFQMTAKDLQQGTVDLAHKFKTLIAKAAGRGFGIAYDADSRRSRLYSKVLGSAGFKQDAEGVWRPGPAANSLQGGSLKRWVLLVNCGGKGGTMGPCPEGKDFSKLAKARNVVSFWQDKAKGKLTEYIDKIPSTKMSPSGKQTRELLDKLNGKLKARYGEKTMRRIVLAANATAWGLFFATGWYIPGSGGAATAIGACLAEAALQGSKAYHAVTGNAEERQTANTRFAFQSSPERIKAFQRWLQQQMSELLTSPTEDEVWQRYAEAGYKKGQGRAFDDATAARRATGRESLDFHAGTKEQFLRSAFGSPVAIERIKVLAGRAFDELRNVTADMATRISRTLTDGLVEGRHPKQIARDLVEQTGISRTRAEAIAATEIVRAHAHGQLDSFRAQGMDKVGIQAEFRTARDEKVCPICKALDGKVYRIEDAYGIVPVHPNCFLGPKIPIYSADGWKPIGDIRVGDLVLTHLGRFREVTQLHRNAGPGTVVEFRLKGGASHTIRVTKDHPIMVGGKWVAAKDIKVGDKVRWLSTVCLGCGKAIPFDQKYCSQPCQWNNENHRKSVSQKNSEANLRQYASGERDAKATTKAANQKMRELLANDEWHPIGVSGAANPAKRLLSRWKNKLGKMGNLNPSRRFPFASERQRERMIQFLKDHPEKHINAILAQSGHVTWIEKFMGDALKRAGIKAKFNHRVEGKWIDWAIVEHKIAVECDGEFWHQDKEKDRIRDEFLKSHGWTVLRFTGSEIKASVDRCADKVLRVLANHDGEYEFGDFEVVRVKSYQRNSLRMYNFSVNEDESYVAKGCVVHNCRCCFLPNFDKVGTGTASPSPQPRARSVYVKGQGWVRAGENPAAAATANAFDLGERRDEKGRWFKGDITQTAAFKEWFGNSRVVDAGGKPLVVYHGTTSKTDFNEFRGGVDEHDNLDEMIGPHFAVDRSVSESFTKEKGTDKPLERGRMFPVYLSVQNPRVAPQRKTSNGELEHDAYAINRDIREAVFPHDKTLFVRWITRARMVTPEQGGEIFDRLSRGESIGNDEYNKVAGHDLSKHKGEHPVSSYVGDYDGGLNMLKGPDKRAVVAAYVKKMQDLGHDGVVYKDTAPDEIRAGQDTTAFIIFHPGQVKSASGNKGSFDRADPSILNFSQEEARNEGKDVSAEKRDSGGKWTSGGGEVLHAATHKGGAGWHSKGKPVPAHVKALAIPPGWSNVFVNHDPQGKIMARGKDSKGREQKRYSKAHEAKQALAKFARVREYLKQRDKILAELEKDRLASLQAKDPVTGDTSDALRVVIQTGARPGSDVDTKATHKSYGITTLEGRHVLEGGRLLRFVAGKHGGKDVEFRVEDPVTALMLAQRAKKAGASGKLFPGTNAQKLQQYSKAKDGGGLKPKDARTAIGTETAQKEVAKRPAPKTEREYKAAVMEVAAVVSKRLGNTPAIALKSYIDPSVFARWKVAAKVTANTFCPTGEGGGVDDSCGAYSSSTVSTPPAEASRRGKRPFMINTPNDDVPDEARPEVPNQATADFLNNYSWGYDTDMNAALRATGKPPEGKFGGREGGKPDVDGPEMFAAIQKVFAAAKVLPKPIPVVRVLHLGKKDKVARLAQAAEAAKESGGVMEMPGFISTSTTASPSFEGDVRFVIRAIHGIDMVPYSHFPDEHEFLMNHNSKFKVRKVNRMSNGDVTIHLIQQPPDAAGEPVGKLAVNAEEEGGRQVAGPELPRRDRFVGGQDEADAWEAAMLAAAEGAKS